MQSKHNYTIDVFRVFCMFGVVAIHVHFSPLNFEFFTSVFSPLAVPFFIVTSLTYYITNLNVEDSCKTSLKKLLIRLVIPFTTWSFVYMILLLCTNILFHQNKTFVLWRMLIYGETAVQLYYLPLLIALQLITLGIFVILNRNIKRRSIGYVSCLFGLVYLIIGDYFNCFGVSSSGQYFGFIIYISFSFFLSGFIKTVKRDLTILITGMLLLAIFLLCYFIKLKAYLWDYWILAPFGGIALLLIAIGFPFKRIPIWVKDISKSTYGIFFSHILFLEAFEILFYKILNQQLINYAPFKFLITLLIFSVSFFFTVLLRRYKITKLIFLGENG